jgi:hypothetical protein
MGNPWAQVGAVAIAWELEKLGIPPPAVWTIDRILRRAGVPKRRARNRYVPKGTPYPVGPVLPRPNTVHRLDLVGPATSRAGSPSTRSTAWTWDDGGRASRSWRARKSTRSAEDSPASGAAWECPRSPSSTTSRPYRRPGTPSRLPVQTCLALGVRVRLILFGEPWRNAVVEHFNDIFDKRFFRTERSGPCPASSSGPPPSRPSTTPTTATLPSGGDPRASPVRPERRGAMCELGWCGPEDCHSAAVRCIGIRQVRDERQRAGVVESLLTEPETGNDGAV